jgi:hypothetical protein
MLIESSDSVNESRKKAVALSVLEEDVVLEST